VGAATFYFFIQLGVFGAYLLLVQHSPDYAYFWLLPIAFLGLYLFTAALANPHVGDHGLHARHGAFHPDHPPAVVFLSPVVYSYEHSIAPKLHVWGVAWLYFLNPITLIMLTFQRAFYVATTAPSTTQTVVVHGHAVPLTLQILPSCRCRRTSIWTWPCSA